jgi:hypothetical protein
VHCLDVARFGLAMDLLWRYTAKTFARHNSLQRDISCHCTLYEFHYKLFLAITSGGKGARPQHKSYFTDVLSALLFMIG